MENETRQSRQPQGMKTATKVAIGVCLVLVAIGTGALVAMMINKGDSVVQKESTQSAVSRVESEKSKSDDTSSQVSEEAIVQNDATDTSSSTSTRQGRYVFGSELRDPMGGKYTEWKETSVGSGRDTTGYRDELINDAQARFNLGKFTHEYMLDATPGGSMRLKYYNIVAENGYLTVSFYGGESGNKNISPQDRWQLVNVYKDN